MLFILVCLLLLMCGVRAPAPVVPNIPSSELSALNALYISTQGANWTWSLAAPGVPWNFTGEPNPCAGNWQGVTCACASGLCHVTSLNLYSHSLHGYLPEDMTNLTQLASIDLSRNGVTGTTPDFSNMTALTQIDFRENRLHGTIPSWLGDMLLTSLNLSTNLFWGTIPVELYQLTNLTLLGLESNFLQGPISPLIGRLANLTDLELGSNNLTGTIPWAICELLELQTLQLEHNALNGSIPNCMGNMSHLLKIFFTENFLTGPIPLEWWSLPLVSVYLGDNLLTGTIDPVNMTYLSIYDIHLNLISGSFPEDFGSNLLLMSVYVYGNHIHGSLPDSFANLQQLHDLDLHNNIMDGRPGEVLTGMPNLNYLYLRGNSFSGPLPASSWLKLFFLETSDNYFTGPIPSVYAVCVGLNYLSVGNNLLSGELPALLVELRAVTYLDVQMNLLTGTLPVNFDGDYLLAQLFVNNNLFTGTLPASIANLTILAELDVSYNQLTGTYPSEYGQLGNLQILFASNNQLRGSLQQLVNASGQVHVANVDVSHNHFTGTLPSEPFKLSSLQSFAASSNCLSGTVPEGICMAVGLTSLILDGLSSSPACRRELFPNIPYFNAFVLQHSLSGTVPSCLFSMPSLRSLHLNGNGLTGTLPDTELIGPLLNIALSHNLLTGTLPLALQRRKLKELDLSYNRIGGQLDANFSAVPPSGALFLQVNRLSGNIPNALQSAVNISILDGNIFYCDLERTELPDNDPQAPIYVCASDAVNRSIYVWLGCMLVVAGAVVIGLLIAVYRRRLRPMQLIIQVYEYICAIRDAWIVDAMASCSRSTSTSTYKSNEDPTAIARLIKLFRAIRVLYLSVGLFIAFVLVPLYLAITQTSNTYTYEYAWQVSAVLLGGTVPAGLLLMGFTAVFCVFGVTAALLIKRLTINPSTVQPVMHTEGSVRQFLRISALAFLNLLTMTAVDCVYVYIVFNYDASIVTITQVSMAAFKIFWNEAALWMLIPLTKGNFSSFSRFSMGKSSLTASSSGSIGGIGMSNIGIGSNTGSIATGSGGSISDLTFRETIVHENGYTLADMRFLVFNTLLNNLIVPAVAIACVSSNCFNNALIAEPTDADEYITQQCAVFLVNYQKSTDTCAFEETVVKTVSYDPQFIYSYQCASTIAMTYSTVFIFMFTISGVILPAVKIAVTRTLYSLEDTTWRTWLKAILPSRFGPPTPEGVGRPIMLFHKGKFAVRAVSYLAIIIAFGSIFPPLALVGCLAMLVITYTEQFLVGSLLLAADRSGLTWYRQELCRQAVGTLEFFHSSFRQIVPFSCIVLGYLIFDTMGYSKGFKYALLIALLFILPPLVLFPLAIRITVNRLIPRVRKLLGISEPHEDMPRRRTLLQRATLAARRSVFFVMQAAAGTEGGGAEEDIEGAVEMSSVCSSVINPVTDGVVAEELRPVGDEAENRVVEEESEAEEEQQV